jgi:hypothetical protein
MADRDVLRDPVALGTVAVALALAAACPWPRGKYEWVAFDALAFVNALVLLPSALVAVLVPRRAFRSRSWTRWAWLAGTTSLGTSALVGAAFVLPAEDFPWSEFSDRLTQGTVSGFGLGLVLAGTSLVSEAYRDRRSVRPLALVAAALGAVAVLVVTEALFRFVSLRFEGQPMLAAAAQTTDAVAARWLVDFGSSSNEWFALRRSTSWFTWDDPWRILAPLELAALSTGLVELELDRRQYSRHVRGLASGALFLLAVTFFWSRTGVPNLGSSDGRPALVGLAFAVSAPSLLALGRVAATRRPRVVWRRARAWELLGTRRERESTTPQARCGPTEEG